MWDVKCYDTIWIQFVWIYSSCQKMDGCHSTPQRARVPWNSLALNCGPTYDRNSTRTPSVAPGCPAWPAIHVDEHVKVIGLEQVGGHHLEYVRRDGVTPERLAQQAGLSHLAQLVALDQAGPRRCWCRVSRGSAGCVAWLAWFLGRRREDWSEWRGVRLAAPWCGSRRRPVLRRWTVPFSRSDTGAQQWVCYRGGPGIRWRPIWVRCAFRPLPRPCGTRTTSGSWRSYSVPSSFTSVSG